jgi:hypothetical protein
MLYKEKENNVARKLGVSTVTLRNWVGLKNSAVIDSTDTQQHPETDGSYRKPGLASGNKSFRPELSSRYAPETIYNNAPENTQDTNYSYAHNLHQNIETIAQCLIDKIDALQQSQVDIHHIEIITDRVFHNIEKLKHELLTTSNYVHSIEHKNRNLEAKLDVLLMQNDTITQQCTHLEALCERFFSKNIDLENKLLTLEHRLHFTEVYEEVSPVSAKTKITTDLDEDTEEAWHYENTTDAAETPDPFNKLYSQPGQTYYTHSEPTPADNQTNAEINLEELMHSKKEVEAFIQNNYPDDYIRIKSYNKKPLFKWINKVLGLN